MLVSRAFCPLNWFVNLAKWSIVPPQCRAWAFSLFSSFGFEYHHISYFVVFLNILDPLDSFMRPSLVWIPLIIEDFCVSRTCPLVWGVILANVIFQEKCIRLKGDYKWFFVSIVKGLSKIVFSHFKRMYLESVSFAFFHANMQNGFSLSIQLKLNFEVISWCFGCSLGFSRCMVTFLGDHLNF